MLFDNTGAVYIGLYIKLLHLFLSQIVGRRGNKITYTVEGYALKFLISVSNAWCVNMAAKNSLKEISPNAFFSNFSSNNDAMIPVQG